MKIITMKKHFYLTSFAIATLLLSLLSVRDKPVVAQLLKSSTVIAQNIQQPKVNLLLVADLQQISQDSQGKQVVSWKPLGGKATVKSGDVLRFTVTAKNEGGKAAKGLVITQPIRKGMIYKLNSATAVAGATLTYSIDNGKTFVANPKIKVTVNGKVEERPAPAEVYTNVRWNFAQQLEPNANVKAGYLVKVL
jgi:uncharacterized repeat protein (TIGR01451 family)